MSVNLHPKNAVSLDNVEKLLYKSVKFRFLFLAVDLFFFTIRLQLKNICIFAHTLRAGSLRKLG